MIYLAHITLSLRLEIKEFIITLTYESYKLCSRTKYPQKTIHSKKYKKV